MRTGTHGSSPGCPSAQLPWGLASTSRAVPLEQRGLGRCGVSQLWVALGKKTKRKNLNLQAFWQSGLCLHNNIHCRMVFYWFFEQNFKARETNLGVSSEKYLPNSLWDQKNAELNSVICLDMNVVLSPTKSKTPFSGCVTGTNVQPFQSSLGQLVWRSCWFQRSGEESGGMGSREAPVSDC